MPCSDGEASADITWMKRSIVSLLASNLLLAECFMIHSNVFHHHLTLWACKVSAKSRMASGFRRTQRRKFPAKRKPAGYWKDVGNIENEIRSLWESVTVNIPSDEPPPIPNEALLNYWKRHDIRSAISQIGGRDILSEEMNGAFVVPGKWKEAAKTVWVKKVIANDQNLDRGVPPPSPQQAKLRRSGDSMRTAKLQDRKRWIHQGSRRQKGFWSSEEVVIEEL